MSLGLWVVCVLLRLSVRIEDGIDPSLSVASFLPQGDTLDSVHFRNYTKMVGYSSPMAVDSLASGEEFASSCLDIDDVEA